jgi:serine/threonine protein kinase HipA of HipAB toxin-antitoxin module
MKLTKDNKSNLEKTYLVCYGEGGWGNYKHINVFVTSNKEVADSYVKKFNTLLSKLEDFYFDIVDSFYEKEIEFGEKEICLEEKSHRVRDVSEAFIKEIEVR